MQKKNLLTSSVQCKSGDILQYLIRYQLQRMHSVLNIQKPNCENGNIISYADQLVMGDEVLIQNYNELIPVKVIDALTLTIQGNNYFE